MSAILKSSGGSPPPRSRGASVRRVIVEDAALLIVTGHALSTEKFEVMGMLLGESAQASVVVRDAVPLCRSDRRKDRVEVDAAQLASASEVAEARGLRVCGWYHSHPHITAAPSAVDARTQGRYQSLDESFVGLICAAFDSQTLKLVAFQSDDATAVPGGFAGATPPSYDDVRTSSLGRVVWRARELPLEIRPTSNGSGFAALRALAGLQDALLREELQCARKWAPPTRSSLLWHSYNAAVFHKALALLAADSLHPLIHLAHTKLDAQRRRRAHLTERRDALRLLRLGQRADSL